MRGAPVGCAMLLLALVAGILLGLFLPDSIDGRAPSTPAPVTATATLPPPTGQPLLPPRLHLPEPTAIATMPPRVQPDPVPVVVPKATQRPRNGLSGQASWFGAPTGTAAAGRPLRAFLGRGWRHDRVRVCGPAGCTRVVLSDWMGNPRRVVDLNPGAFVAVCGDLRRGVCQVTVTRP